MAARQLVLCSPLCFMVHKYGKSAVQILKSVVLDFYSVEELVAAKRQLLSDTEDLKSSVELPHVPERRDGEHRAVRTVDDIFVILRCIDEHLKLDSLPRYVVESPDSLPSMRLYEGDMAAIMNILQKLISQVSDHGVTLSAIINQVQAMNKQVQARSSTAKSACSDQLRYPPTQPSQVSCSQTVVGQYVSQLADFPALDTVGRSADDQTAKLGSRPEWAVMTSSPVVCRNRYDALPTTDDEQNTDSAGAQPFTEYQMRSNKRSRRRTSPDNRHSTSQECQQQQQPLQGQPSRSRQQAKRLLMGKGCAGTTGLAAARRIIKKAVFCVDNVDPTCNADSLRNFVTKMNVNVVTCFEVKPRRQRHEVGPVHDRKAFRLCIDSNDCTRMLVDSQWPESVLISEWYFRPPTDDRRSATAVSATCSSSTGATTKSTFTSAAATTDCVATTSLSHKPIASSASASSSADILVADDVMDHRSSVEHNNDYDNNDTIMMTTYNDGATVIV